MRISHLYLSVVCLFLSACSGYAVGPDLETTRSPFGTQSNISLIGTDEFKLTARIRHSQGRDVATVQTEDLGSKTYRAEVTYFPFFPQIAETNTDRQDYWLIGLNFTQTPDRSVYALLRYPHGKPLSEGDSLDILPLKCVYITSKDAHLPEEEAEPATIGKGRTDETEKQGVSSVRLLKSGSPFDTKDGFNTERCELDTPEEARLVGPFVVERLYKLRQESLRTAKSDDEIAATLDMEWPKAILSFK